MTTTSIACTLAPGMYRNQLRWIGELNRAALRAHRRGCLTLTLTYASHAAPRVRELVERERACCGFLEFRLDEAPGEVRLAITAPDAVREVSDAIFAPFLSGVADVTTDVACRGESCGCSTGDSDPPPGGTATTGRSSGAGRVHGIAATTAGAAALACGVCCVVPLVFPSLAVTTLGAAVAVFAGAYRWAVEAAILLTAVGWVWLGWESVRTRRRPGLSTLGTMGAATVLVLAALAWPRLEPLVRKAFRT